MKGEGVQVGGGEEQGQRSGWVEWMGEGGCDVRRGRERGRPEEQEVNEIMEMYTMRRGIEGETEVSVGTGEMQIHVLKRRNAKNSGESSTIGNTDK